MSPDEIAPFRSRGERPIVWFRHGREHSNHCCPYCGRLVGPDSPVASDKEHLVARKFVPSGRLAGNAFNFIFHARRDCNGEKAGAERHISTVTLLRSPDRIYRPSGSLLRSAADSDARYIGTELSLNATWQATPHLSATAIYAHFIPGRFIEETGASDHIDFVELTVKLLF